MDASEKQTQTGILLKFVNENHTLFVTTCINERIPARILQLMATININVSWVDIPGCYLKSRSYVEI